MIGKLCISYNPDQHTYNSIREKFSLSKNNPSKKFDDNPITEISTLDLYYEQWGHVCFFDTTIDMNLLFRNQKVSLTPMDELDYKKFRILLAKAYIETLGKEIAEKINILEQFNCTYVEYISFLKVSHPDEIMCQLKQSKFKKEQLDINCFEIVQA